MKLTPESITDFILHAEAGDIRASDLVEAAQSITEDMFDRESIHVFLDAAAHHAIQKCIADNSFIDPWLQELIRMMECSGYHMGHVIEGRAKRCGDKPVFQIIQPDEIVKISYKQLWKYVRRTGLGMLSLAEGKEPTVGILTPNTFKGALVDLACLSFGFKVVPLPLNSTSEDLSYIIDHAGITHIFSGGQRAAGLLSAAVLPTTDIQIIQLRAKDLTSASHLGWDAFLANGSKIEESDLLARRNHLDINGLATVMYTSGTTAHPKGIVFTPMNLVSKRFARALALPEIGPDDIFLSFLPLYHTFGRYLEMLGSIFLCATYTFARSPQFRSLLADFKIIRPTVFISVPKRWSQIREQCDGKSLDEITGGRLKWGLSAAGYLEPEVFRFFQKNNVSLMSGYGMTEATGGITMTPPEDYKPDSVGMALPGVEIKLAEDGELMIRGAYVSPGYLGEQQTVLQRESSWFYTGDIFEETDGHFTIVDRKKEIYKNSRGQTIAPQKIENLFKDFDSIQSVFLVGDGLEYNCILIFPNHGSDELESPNDPQELRDHFAAIVSSVNSFLPPHERLVNFAIISRAFTSEHGELTKKGTYKRKSIIQNFASVIEPMYEHSTISFIQDGIELRIPNWILREKGVLSSDVEWNGNTLAIKGNPMLTLSSREGGLQIGDFEYTLPKPVLNLETFLRSPALWLGNIGFVDFMESIPFRLTEFSPSTDIGLLAKHVPLTKNTGQETVPFPDNEGKTKDFLSFLHTQAIVLRGNSTAKITAAVSKLRVMTEQPGSIWNQIIPSLLFRLQTHPKVACRSAMLDLAISFTSPKSYAEIARGTLALSYEQNDLNAVALDPERFEIDHIRAFLNQIQQYKVHPDDCKGFPSFLIKTTFNLLVDYGINRLNLFLKFRTELTSWDQPFLPSGIQESAGVALRKLEKSFRAHLPSKEISIPNIETGEILRWKDVISFDEGIEPSNQIRITEAVEKTQLLNEALTLSKREPLSLENFPIGGIWISAHEPVSIGRAFRLLVRPKNDEPFNLILRWVEPIEEHSVKAHVHTMALSGPTLNTNACGRLLFGYYPDYHIFTEAFSSLPTVEDLLQRHREDIESGLAADRWHMSWFHYIWTSAQLSLEIWKRSGCRLALPNPNPSQFIIPEHDYSDGGYIETISSLTETKSLLILVHRFTDSFISQTEKTYTGLSMMADWEVILTVILEVFGMDHGLEMLKKLKEEIANETDFGLSQKTVAEFIEDVESNGILPKKLVFATMRYERWTHLNPNAAAEAKSELILELYRDYRLAELLQEDASIRLRFFLMTCFKDSHENLKTQLERLVQETRKGRITEADMTDRLQKIHKTGTAVKEDQFFLTRLVFEHVGSGDFAELVSQEGESSGRLDLSVLINDTEGVQYAVRPPARPKEIAQFNSYLKDADIFVPIKQDHEFVLLFTTDDRLAGGVFWRRVTQDIAHLEKVVIAPEFRGKGLSIRLIDELVFRLHSRFYSHVTVGFMHSDLFYKIGFKIDSRFGGLVLPIKEKVSS